MKKLKKLYEKCRNRVARRAGALIDANAKRLAKMVQQVLENVHVVDLRDVVEVVVVPYRQTAH